jgi:hypothetical protein
MAAELDPKAKSLIERALRCATKLLAASIVPLGAVVGGAKPAQATGVTLTLDPGQPTPAEQAGLAPYEYTGTNNSGTGYPFNEVRLFLNNDPTLAGLFAPAAWSVAVVPGLFTIDNATYHFEVDWTTNDGISGGSSLDGFGVQSDLPLVDRPYEVLSSFFGGVIDPSVSAPDGPPSTPEPGSVALAFLAAASAGFRFRRRG